MSTQKTLVVKCRKCDNESRTVVNEELIQHMFPHVNSENKEVEVNEVCDGCFCEIIMGE